eukprot:1195733-Prorocentrum_minimum.AAC.6
MKHFNITRLFICRLSVSLPILTYSYWRVRANEYRFQYLCRYDFSHSAQCKLSEPMKEREEILRRTPPTCDGIAVLLVGKIQKHTFGNSKARTTWAANLSELLSEYIDARSWVALRFMGKHAGGVRRYQGVAFDA